MSDSSRATVQLPLLRSGAPSAPAAAPVCPWRLCRTSAALLWERPVDVGLRIHGPGRNLPLAPRPLGRSKTGLLLTNSLLLGSHTARHTFEQWHAQIGFEQQDPGQSRPERKCARSSISWSLSVLAPLPI